MKNNKGMLCPYCKKQLKGVDWTQQELSSRMDVYILICTECRCIIGTQLVLIED